MPSIPADRSVGQERPPKPSALPVIPEAIPPELKALSQWVVWRYTWDDDRQDWTKVPLNPRTGNKASSTNPKTWTSFDFAYQRYQESQTESWRFDGIGLVLRPENNLIGFDLDDCRNPETSTIAPWALKIVEQVRTYWEISTSGTGLRGIGKGRKPGSRCRTGDFEMYTHGRYLCITGHHLEGTPTTIEAVQEAIDTIYAKMFPSQERQTSSNGHSPHADDVAILNDLRRFKNGAKFSRLFDDGDISEYDGNHSVADQGLCRLIAFRTQDPDQVDRIFRLSALCRGKWESRADYRDQTIARAITHVRDRYQGVSAESNGQPSEEPHSSEDRNIGNDEQDIPQGEITLETVIETFREWLDLPDPGFVEILLGAYAANQIPGDPVWILGVGPSSGGKTEPLLAMLGLPRTKLASTLTESALLSGSPKRDKDKQSTGGLLRELGTFGYLILKDFTSVLAMQDKIRMSTVAALREIYDGRWDRPLGVDGGRVLPWSGKVALLAGCTDVIDSHHVLMTAMGSRFLMYRLPLVDAHAQASMAYDMNAREDEMRGALRRVVRGFFHGRAFKDVRPTQTESMRERIIQLSMLAVVARSPIERDRHSREITLIPDPEAPARVTKALGKLYAGLCAIGVSAERAWTLIRKTAVDSMPKLRYVLLKKLSEESEQTSWDLAIKIHHPTSTTKRALEDLNALKLVERKKVDGKKGDRWSLTEETAIRLGQLPETIENDKIC
jgi:hypothetical protein